MKKMLFLVNPVAGTNVIGNQMIPILDTFCKADFDVTVRVSQSGRDVYDTFYREAGNYDTLVCCGGDGTLNTATGALIASGKQPHFGYIPAGTVNDFATTHGIPKDPLAAARLIAEGNHRLIDIGDFNGRPFVYVAAFGSLADVSYATPQSMKHALGKTAYILEGAKSLLNLEPFHLKITVPASEHQPERVIEDDFIHGSFSNSRSIGGFKLPIMRDYCFNDGLMEILLVRRPKNLAQANQILSVIITQKAVNDQVIYLQTPSVHYEAEKPIPWTLDGEFGGAHHAADISMRREILDMIC